MEKYKVEIKWGFIFISVQLLWMVFERFMGWHSMNIDQHATMTMIFAIFAIAVYVFALLDKRKTSYNGVMSWKRGFISGCIITVMVVLLSPLAQLVTHIIIAPDFFGNMIEHTVETGYMERKAAESYFSLSSYIMQSMIGALGMGIVTSAVVAAFTKRSN